MTTALAIVTGTTIGLAAALRRARRLRTPRSPICPTCHVSHGWHRMSAHEAEAVS